MHHLLARVIAAYESAQVELHGKYSVERVAELHAYQRKFPFHRCLLLLLATPLPCLTIIVLTDLVPLTPVSAGPALSHVLWARVFIVALAIAATLLEQGRHFVPGLPCSTRTLWVISAFVASCTSVYARLLGSLVGFPTPFLVIMCSPCFLSTLGICGFIQWGRLVRAQPGLQTALISYIKIMVVQFALTALYPGYNYLFLQHSGPEQTAIAMLLPVLKLFAKNAVSLVFNPQLEDFRPGVVILNVEVFHALFVSCCMQSSKSWVTTVALMCTDFIHSWFGVRDIDIRLAAIKTLDDKLGKSAKSTPKRPKPLSLIEKSLFFVRSDHGVKRDASVRHRPAGISFVATPWSAVVPFDASEQVSPPRAKEVSVAPTTKSLISGRYDSLAELTTPERIEYVSVTLQVLHIAEFLLLVEFVEVVIPVIYCVYMTAMFFLPNRAYYPQLAAMDAHALLSTIGSVIAYAALEFVSFVGLCFALKRKLQVSPIHQLAYVIHTQWNLVQSKMILWVVFSVHVTLEHFGYDYSFRFAWLRGS